MFKKTEENIVIIVGLVAFGIIVVISIFTSIIFNIAYVGMTCDEMVDWSGTPEHQVLIPDEDTKFHAYYFEQCNEFLEMNMTEIQETIIASNYTGE